LSQMLVLKRVLEWAGGIQRVFRVLRQMWAEGLRMKQMVWGQEQELELVLVVGGEEVYFSKNQKDLRSEELVLVVEEVGVILVLEEEEVV